MSRRIDARVIMVNLAVVAIAASWYMNLSSLQVLFPLNNMVTEDRAPLFEWSGAAGSYELLIDDDQDFSSPMAFNVSGNRYRPSQELDFGTYWFKLKSEGAETMPRKFTVVSSVALSRQEMGTIRNSGNTALLVHMGGLTGAVTLAVNRTLEIGENEDVKAEQK